MPGVIITGAGSGLPKKIVTNKDLEKIVDTNDEWIRSRTGIEERRILSGDETIIDLCVEASNQALEDSGVKAEDIDLIICGTVSQAYMLPSQACYIQKEIGAVNATAFDLGAACSGWIYGFITASQFIKTGAYKNILVIGADALSPYTDWSDRSTCVIFADGAGATVVSATDDDSRGLLSWDMGSDGRHSEILTITGGGSLAPATYLVDKTKDAEPREKYFIQMEGNELFKIITRLTIASCKKAVEKAGISVDDIDHVIAHQANTRIIQFVCKSLGVSYDKATITMDKLGNCSGGTVPITIRAALDRKNIKKGDTVLMTAFGGGLTWGSAIIKW